MDPHASSVCSVQGWNAAVKAVEAAGVTLTDAKLKDILVRHFLYLVAPEQQLPMALRRLQSNLLATVHSWKPDVLRKLWSDSLRSHRWPQQPCLGAHRHPTSAFGAAAVPHHSWPSCPHHRPER
jgi:hypothetical protein